ncbi:hypothetical protein GCM10009129_00790 [Psychrobacter aestuarii]|uniref:Uncharacterized protein n=1 Tax=Psychrobacter aestuarii TaxID=556327 RepID=A0ABN0VJL3_9GAMM
MVLASGSAANARLATLMVAAASAVLVSMFIIRLLVCDGITLLAMTQAVCVSGYCDGEALLRVGGEQ